jgi:hypothetical protein
MLILAIAKLENVIVRIIPLDMSVRYLLGDSMEMPWTELQKQ